MRPDLCPPQPENVPADLTAAGPGYRILAWGALVALLLLVAAYLSLTVWFGYVAGLRLWNPGDHPSKMLLGIPPALLCFFLLKALFHIRRGQREPLVIELDPKEEANLHAFVMEVAHEVKAPRPHRIFLSSQVNAAVFYDLSILNLILPTKKNLEIGLGLINVLTLDEFKAVLAHEFGHFAQRSMAIGRWVYTAQQVIAHIVTGRDAFDRFLDTISRIDVRIAWIGWLMRLLVWSLRATFDTAFRGVVVLERSLSRQMEFQADLVSVSVTGSDSLVHALKRLQSADDAWDLAYEQLIGLVEQGQAVEDFFALQRHIERRMAEIRGQSLDRPQPEFNSDRATHRVFSTQLAQPPKMWSSHPPNHERENNAKHRYLPSIFDDRSAWNLFRQPQQTKHRLTRQMIERLTDQPLSAMSVEDAVASVDDKFDRVHLNPRYRGAYLGRSVVRRVADPSDLYAPTPTPDPQAILRQLNQLYPESLNDTLERWRGLSEEHRLLRALEAGVLDAPGGIILFRGRKVPRKELKTLIASVNAERDEVTHALLAEDRAARTAHRDAAKTLGPDWESHLLGLANLLHYLEHTRANLSDAQDYLRDVIRVTTADGVVTKKEMKRVVAAAQDVWLIVNQIVEAGSEVTLPAAVLAQLDISSWEDALQNLDESAIPSETALQSGWLESHQPRVQTLRALFARARLATLETLLKEEDRIAQVFVETRDPGPAPTPATVPPNYPVFLPGMERKRDKKLDLWNRFQLADGFWPGAARFALAALVLWSALYSTL